MSSEQATSREREVSLEEETQHRYLNYALSVITSRALPDVRDGLKPVQRRILYAMYHDQHLLPDARFRKCASVVGDVLGKYHPHGDQSVYDALARMAQDFSLRYPQIDGYGNFGSQDGDPPAAYRYTECRLKPYSTKLLDELSQDTVDFRPTFDGTRTEPIVLPAQLPNLLLNGSYGIAVGMATSIPPHNAKEVLTACLKLIDSPTIESPDLMKFIKGPDFPTGGMIVATPKELTKIYETGHGTIRLRAEYKVEKRTDRRSLQSLIITSIPYGIDRSSIMEQIGKIILEKRLPQILGCRDESSSEVRIVVELKAEVDPPLIMGYLYQSTQLQIHVQINFTSLIPVENSEVGTPKQLSLLECLQHFLRFRFEVTTRKISFQLKAVLRRIHILEGFVQIYDALDEVLAMVRSSSGKADAAKKLRARFSLDEEQVGAILETKIYQLARLEIELIRTELAKQEQERTRLATLLAHDTPRWELIRKELASLRTQYGDERRTHISLPESEESFDPDRLLPVENAYLILTKEGWIRKMSQVRDVASLKVREPDTVIAVLSGSTLDRVCFFTNFGSLYTARIGDFPTSTGYGEPIQKFFKFRDAEQVISVFALGSDMSPENDQFFAITHHGLSLRLPLKKDGTSSQRSGRKFIKLDLDDRVLGVGRISAQSNLILVTKQGFVKTCVAKEIKLIKGVGRGTPLLRLEPGDEVCAFSVDKPLQVEDNLGKIFNLDPKDKRTTALGKIKKLPTQGHILKRTAWVSDSTHPNEKKKDG